MQTLEQCLKMYRDRLGKLDPEFAEMNLCTLEQLMDLRRRLRGFLHDNKVATNPGVTDVWLLDRVEEVKKHLPYGSIQSS